MRALAGLPELFVTVGGRRLASADSAAIITIRVRTALAQPAQCALCWAAESPLGVDPALPALACRWLTAELASRDWSASDTCLVIASHGSGRSRNSARDTERFSNALGEQMSFAEIRTGYIEEPPYLGDLVFETGPQAICLPFFAAGGGHVQQDIPEALDLASFDGLRLYPIGTHPEIPTLIARALIRTETKSRVA